MIPSRSFVRLVDVAREAGVSQMTVSNAYRFPHKVLLKTRQQVFQAAEALGYVPNFTARDLASGDTRFVAALVPTIKNSNFARMIEGLNQALVNESYQLLIGLGDSQGSELEAVKGLMGHRPTGIVLVGGDHSHATRKLLRKLQISVVETWNLDGPHIDMAAGFSLYAAAYDLTRYLISKGYKKIGFAGYSSSRRRYGDRQKGFQDALREVDLQSDLIVTAAEDLGYSGGGATLMDLLRQEPSLDAVVCTTDIFAAGALFECRRLGLSVPRDIAIAGFGDFEIAAAIEPTLTTVRTNGFAIGQCAGNLILKRARREAMDSKIHDVGYEIVVRGST